MCAGGRIWWKVLISLMPTRSRILFIRCMCGVGGSDEVRDKPGLYFSTSFISNGVRKEEVAFSFLAV